MGAGDWAERITGHHYPLRRNPAVLLLGLTVIVAACSPNPTDLRASTPEQVTTYSENYQEIYRRVASEARLCYRGSVGAYASAEVDANLYSDLGYGEVQNSVINYGTHNYYWTAKIEKNGSGSKMTINAGNTLSASATTATLQRWASGGTGC